MISVKSAFYRVAVHKLKEQISEQAGNLALGNNARTFEEYRERVGEIRALRGVLDLLDEVEDELSGRKRETEDASDDHEA